MGAFLVLCGIPAERAHREQAPGLHPQTTTDLGVTHAGAGIPARLRADARGPTVAGQRRIRTGFPHVGACAAADELTTFAETSSKRLKPVI
jgi:hypothetical protein